MGTRFWEVAIWGLFTNGFAKHALSGSIRFPVHDQEAYWVNINDITPVVFYEGYVHWQYYSNIDSMQVVVEHKRKRVLIKIPGEVLNTYLSNEFLDWLVTKLYYDNVIELTDEEKYWNELFFEKGATYPDVYEKTVPNTLLRALEVKLDKYVLEPAPFSHQGYADSGRKLVAVVPGLNHKVMDGCPACNEYQGRSLEEIIIHLNDKHKWPRVVEDAEPGYKGPTIVDWVDEYALEMHLDMTFHEEEIKSEPKRQHPPF